MFTPQLLQLWSTGAKDNNEEVRNNSVFGLGEMILYGKECLFPYPLKIDFNSMFFFNTLNIIFTQRKLH